jgi:hypothetical protein
MDEYLKPTVHRKHDVYWLDTLVEDFKEALGSVLVGLDKGLVAF